MFFCRQKTACELRIRDWSSDVCSSNLPGRGAIEADRGEIEAPNGGTDTPSGDSSPTQSPSAAEPTSAGRAPLPGARDLPTVDELAPSPTQPAEVSEVVDAEIGRASCRERVCQDV